MEADGESPKRYSNKKLNILIIIMLIVVILALIICLCLSFTENSCQSPDCLKASYDLLSVMNTSVDPCDDFFDFVCGNFDEMYPNDDFMVKIVEKRQRNKFKSLFKSRIRKNDSPGVKLQKKFFQLCFNERAIEDNKNEEFLNIIHQLGGWPIMEGPEWNPNNFNLFEFLTICRNLGVNFEWLFTIDINEYGELKLAYPEVNTVLDNKRDDYGNIIVTVCKYFGFSTSYYEAREMMTFEKKLGNLVEDAKLNDWESTKKVSYLKILWNLDWQQFLKNITQKNYEEVVLDNENYFIQLKDLIRRTKRRTISNYLIWKIVETFSVHLDRRTRNLFRDYADIVNRTQIALMHLMVREEVCFDYCKTYFDRSPVEYIKKYIPLEQVKKVHELFDFIKDLLRKKIQMNQWMDEKTTELALEKLDSIIEKIGPSYSVYDEETLDENLWLYFSNASNIIDLTLKMQKYYMDEYFQNQSDNKADDHFNMFFDARFIRINNEIIISAPLMVDIFFNEHRPNYLNFGTVATIIAHEMVHGFDYRNDWYTNQTLDYFWNRTSCLLNCNSILDIEENCTATFNENFADYAGIDLTYEAYQNWQLLNGVEPKLVGLPFNDRQLFWIAYTNLMCHGKVSSEEQIRSDHKHMMPKNRILASFRNSKYFADDFKCSTKSKMNPANKCQYF